MADEDPFSDEALGLGGRVPLASLGYDQTAEDRQTDSSDPFSNKALGLDANGLPTQGTFADYLWSHSPEGHILNAFGQGSKDAWGAVSTMRDDTLKALKDAGLHSDFVKSHMDVAKIFNQAFIRPAVNAAALVAGGIAGPIGGLMSAGVQVGTEFRSEAEKQNKTFLGQAVAPLLGGIGEMTQAVSSGQYFGEGGLEGVHKADALGAERVQAKGVLDHIIEFQKDELAETLGRQAATQDGLYKARAEGTIGEGEEGYFNTRVPTDEQLKSRAEAAQEAGLPPRSPEPPISDVHELARQIAPETFQEFATHRQIVNDLADQLAVARKKKFEQPEIAALVKEEEALGRKKKLTTADKERLEKVTNQLDAVNLSHTPEEVELHKQLSAAHEKLSDSQDEIQKVYDHARNLIPDGPTVPEVPLSPEMVEARKTGEPPAPELPSTAPEKPVQPPQSLEEGVGTSQPQEGPVEAPKGYQRPSVEGTGDTRTRGLARSLEAKAIKDDLLETGLELPEYRKMTLDKELQAVADHTADHYKDAVQIAMGEKAPPEGHYPESYLIAVQRAATAKGDVETIKALATRSELLTEATDMGRRLRILAELNKEDPVAAIKTLSEARKNSLARKGVNIQGEVQNISNDIDQRIFDGASNTDLETLIKSIECP